MKIKIIWSMLILLLLGSSVVGKYTTPCLHGNFSLTRCGNCLEAEYGVKPAEFLGLMWARCTKCYYYVPNGKIITDTRELSDLGANGCTWMSAAFILSHPPILALIVLISIFFSLLLCFCVGKQAIPSGTYRRHKDESPKIVDKSIQSGSEL